MKATEQYFPMVLFIMLYKVVLTFQSVDEIVPYDHSNESFLAIRFFGANCFSLFYEIKFGIFLNLRFWELWEAKGLQYSYPST